MASPETTATAIDAPETKECSKCAESKVVSPETWPYRKGRTGRYQAYGAVCLVCERARKAEYESRRDKIKAMVAAEPAGDASGAKKQAKLDVAEALRAGGKVLNEYAPSVLARLLQYADDPEHPMHQWALDKLVDRVLPRKLYEELGGQAAGVGGLNDKRPTFLIQVLPAQPAESHGGHTVEGEVRVVQSLPAPKE
jgi:hypothetical protein